MMKKLMKKILAAPAVVCLLVSGMCACNDYLDVDKYV
jgi:4-hydroxybenzoate polyprenyltransferase